MYTHQNKLQNLYQKWIDTYAGEEFGLLVEKAIRIGDEVADTYTPYPTAIYELMFL